MAVATILRAPDRLSAAQQKKTTTLYLAGTFADSWRDAVIAALHDLDVTIIDPRNDRWPELPVGSPGRRGAYDWQMSMAFDADVVIVWVPTGAVAPTALMILGALGVKRNNAKRGNTVVVGGEGHGGLVGLFARNQRLFPVAEDLGEVIRIARLQLEALIAARSGA